MTKQMQPIDLPSYELVQRLMHESGFDISDPDDEMLFPDAKFMKLASRLIQHGADMELEACLYWVGDGRRENLSQVIGLRTARRPKPPSLKEQALAKLAELEGKLGNDFPKTVASLRRTLEALPND